MGCNCGTKRKALAQAVKARDARRAVAVARSGLREMLTGVDDGAVAPGSEQEGTDSE